MNEDIILISISNHVLTTYFHLGGGPSMNNNYLAEAFKIIPYYPLLKFLMEFYFKPLLNVLDNLNENICFLEIDDKYENIKISCDWCSICNGIIETAKKNIVSNPQLLSLINFEKLKLFDNYLDYILIDRKEKITNDQIYQWTNTTFNNIIYNNIYLLGSLYLKLELVELRWCPFKRSKEFYYRNIDNKFLNPTEEVIKQIGYILYKYETITCNNCPKLVNDNWKFTKSNTKSIFQPLLDQMLKQINIK
jgi:hypothetical protein